MPAPKEPEEVYCPECGEEAKLVPHSPFSHPGVDPHQERIVICQGDHWKQKIELEYIEDQNQLVQAEVPAEVRS